MRIWSLIVCGFLTYESSAENSSWPEVNASALRSGTQLWVRATEGTICRSTCLGHVLHPSSPQHSLKQPQGCFRLWWLVMAPQGTVTKLGITRVHHAPARPFGWSWLLGWHRAAYASQGFLNISEIHSCPIRAALWTFCAGLPLDFISVFALFPTLLHYTAL